MGGTVCRPSLPARHWPSPQPASDWRRPAARGSGLAARRSEPVGGPNHQLAASPTSLARTVRHVDQSEKLHADQKTKNKTFYDLAVYCCFQKVILELCPVCFKQNLWKVKIQPSLKPRDSKFSPSWELITGW